MSYRVLNNRFTVRRHGTMRDLTIEIVPRRGGRTSDFAAFDGKDLVAWGTIKDGRVRFEYIRSEEMGKEVEAAIHYMGWCD